jgi:predicted MFS family arabinose efflux permease
LSPFSGKLVDKVGYHLSFVLLAIVLMTIAHSLIAFTYISPFICSTLISFVYVLNSASIWTMVSIIVEGEDRIATAYGLVQSIQNLGLALSNLFVGNIIDHYGYFVLEITFIFILLSK